MFSTSERQMEPFDFQWCYNAMTQAKVYPLEMCEDWNCPSGDRCQRMPRNETQITAKTIFFPHSSARGSSQDCVFFLDRRTIRLEKR